MREIVVDTETTGLSPAAGHRIVEIGCLELVNHVPTGEVFQEYLNPEREVPAEVVEIHGLTNEFLDTKPRFTDIADAFLDFLGDAHLIIHNAEFDLGFINAELRHLGRKDLDNNIVDTVALARKKFRGGQVSLDALCRRFNIDNSARVKHGALLDTELLAEVYLELVGGRQPGLNFISRTVEVAALATKTERAPRAHAPTTDELAAHESLLNTLKNPVWHR